MDYSTLVLLLVLSISPSIKPTASVTPALLLTPLIKENKTEDARRLSLVNPSLFLNVTSHSGFLTVDPRYNSNTFFWYFPVANKPVNETPWILWLQGGPGATSLAGLFDEVGPFEYDGALKLRQWSWSRNYSMVFFDNPVGAGFSFTDNELGFSPNKTTYSNHLYSALQQFLTVFPDQRKAPLYIAGESYAGRYIPSLASKILDAGKLPTEWEINLQGLIMGNPVMNREDIANLTAAYYQWGLLDSAGVLAVKPLQDNYMNAVKSGNYLLAYQYRDALIDKLTDLSMQQQQYNALKNDDYHFNSFEEYISQEDVREALHVGEIKFSFDNFTVHQKLIPDFLSNVETDVEKLLDKYRILIYCGQLDLTAPCVPNAEARRQHWHWKGREEFLTAPRVPWWYNETVAGYVKSGGGFTEALVRDAGHLVPIEKPAQAFQLIHSFIRALDMELPPNYSPITPNLPSIITQTTKLPEVTTIFPNTTKSNTNDTRNNQNSTDVTVKPISNDSVTSLPIVKKEKPSDKSGPSPGTIVSIILNVILVLVIVGGAALYYIQKRRNEEFFYNNVDNNSDDIFLT